MLNQERATLLFLDVQGVECRAGVGFSCCSFARKETRGMPASASKRVVLNAATLIAATAVPLGLNAPAVASGVPVDDPPPNTSNAEWLDPLCAVPSERDLDVTTKIYTISQERDVDDKVVLAAFEAGWVESHMNNLDCGDKDSVGVFQQRPSQGWCDGPAQCMNVRHATNSFLDVAVSNNESHPGYTAGELAQSVQRSAYPDRYDKNREKARKLIEEARKETRGSAS